MSRAGAVRDLGGLTTTDGARTVFGRVLRSGVHGDLASAEAGAVIDLRSLAEREALPHPLAHIAGYRRLPLIDPAAEARRGRGGSETLGEVYRGSLRRNAGNIAAILAAAAQEPAPLLVSCTAGKDRTGMICAILLDLAKVRRADIAADYSATEAADPAPILSMLNHIDAVFGGAQGYLRFLNLDPTATGSLTALLR